MWTVTSQPLWTGHTSLYFLVTHVRSFTGNNSTNGFNLLDSAYLSSTLPASYISCGVHPLGPANEHHRSVDETDRQHWSTTTYQLSAASPHCITTQRTVGPLASGPPGRDIFSNNGQDDCYITNAATSPAHTHAHVETLRDWELFETTPITDWLTRRL